MPPPIDRWQRVKDIFDAAVELPQADRAGYLRRECGEDETLRREVESLLSSDEQADGFIEDPAFAIPRDLFPEPPPDAMVGRQFGRYQILSEIGRGGLGAVYLAARSDDAYQKRVAVKVVRRGLDTEDILRRFRHERQILAQLDHPNIARLIDGGTTDDGLPYFVMEYVEGEPIAAYCDLHVMDTTQRLQLFQKVCAAVTYAHQNLVIHRDLKPSNILVTVGGEPKLLDFGIAKLLTADDEMFTQTAPGLRVMTPEYASPEQIRGEKITTTSDIYSLGVLLYELLTGQRPYRLKTRTADEISRAVVEQEPPRPSTVIAPVDGHARAAARNPKSLRGDLDNIVMMAMRKDPHRRYVSVSQLAADLRRHLEGLPVIAHKDSVAYRAGKFVRRNKLAVAAAFLILAALVGGMLTTLREKRRAERRFNDVRQLANAVLFKFDDAIKDLPGSTPARALVVTSALEYLDSLAQESGTDAGLQRELAFAYIKVGNVQGNPTNANLGDSAGALQSYRKAGAIAEKLASRSNDPQVRRALALVAEKTSDIQASSGQIEDAVRSAKVALAGFQALADANPGDPAAQRSLAISHLKVGDFLGNPNLLNVGDTDGAMQSYRAALAILEPLYAADATDQQTRRFVGLIHERIGAMLEAAGEVDGTVAEYEKSLAIRVPLAKENPTNTQIVRDAAIAYEKMANAMVLRHDLEGALVNRRKSLEIFRELVKADPANAIAQQSLAVSYGLLGDLLAGPDAPNLGRTAEAVENYRAAVQISERMEQAGTANVETRRQLTALRPKIASLSAARPQ
jgi:non-specific serine/threonine protein kinase/serine/threonine-protein kinase